MRSYKIIRSSSQARPGCTNVQYQDLESRLIWSNILNSRMPQERKINVR